MTQHVQTASAFEFRTTEFGAGPARLLPIFFLGFSYHQHTRHFSSTDKRGCKEWTVTRVLQHAATYAYELFFLRYVYMHTALCKIN